MSSKYPKDQFDEVDDNGPVGAHRKPPSAWQPVLPFLIVLLVVPLLAWGTVALIQRNVPAEELVEVLVQSEDAASGEPEVEEVVEVEEDLPETDLPTADRDDKEQDKAASEKTEKKSSKKSSKKKEKEEEPVNYNASIVVLNATAVEGYAAGSVATLNNAGFYNAWGDNAGAMTAAQNTVYYASAQYKATAEAVAAALGLGTPVEDPGTTGGADLVVLLVN